MLLKDPSIKYKGKRIKMVIDIVMNSPTVSCPVSWPWSFLAFMVTFLSDRKTNGLSWGKYERRKGWGRRGTMGEEEKQNEHIKIHVIFNYPLISRLLHFIVLIKYNTWHYQRSQITCDLIMSTQPCLSNLARLDLIQSLFCSDIKCLSWTDGT